MKWLSELGISASIQGYLYRVNSSDLHLPIGELGERAALALGLSPLRRGHAAEVPTGDDAAVVGVDDGRFVITTDTMFQGADFLTTWSTPFDLGWKAIASNAADVAAMGAKSIAFTVALGLPASSPVSWLHQFASGLQAAIDALCPEAEVVGGDLATSEQIVIAVTATGQLSGRNPVLRSGAKPGHVVALAGTLGKAAAGLSLLQKGERQFIDAYEELVAVQLRPQPPLTAGPVAADASASAMLDVSDGLLLDADRIAKSSAVVIRLDSLLLEGYQAVLELAAQSLGNAGLTQSWVLSGGEDHGLLATFPPDVELPRGFKRIGNVVDVLAGQQPEVQLWRAGNRVDLGADATGVQTFGWDSVRRVTPS